MQRPDMVGVREIDGQTRKDWFVLHAKRTVAYGLVFWLFAVVILGVLASILRMF